MSDAKKAILVVDDEQNIRLMLRTTLEGDGYPIREATGAAEAMESIEQDVPGVVLLDLWMPGEHGMTVLERLNQWPAEKRPRVIVLTAHGGMPDCVRAMRLGASDFLQKPTTPEALRKSVDEAMREGEEKSARHAPATNGGRSTRREVGYSQTLVRIQHAIWNSDITRTEQTLAECFRKAATDPAYYNVLGVAFEAEGNREAARTFYQKATATGACEAAKQNLLRLEELEKTGATRIEVALGSHSQFVEKLCMQTQILHSESLDGCTEEAAQNRS